MATDARARLAELKAWAEHRATTQADRAKRRKARLEGKPYADRIMSAEQQSADNLRAIARLLGAVLGKEYCTLCPEHDRIDCPCESAEEVLTRAALLRAVEEGE